MRRLHLLPCPEAWDRMHPDGDGRLCTRCHLRVTDTTALTPSELEQRLDAAAHKNQRVCLRLELDHGHPRTTFGLAAALTVSILTGCASTQLPTPFETMAERELQALEIEPGQGAHVSGVVLHRRTNQPIEGAIVVLQSTSLPTQQERMTNARGIYRFDDLPPGHYTIQALDGFANTSKVFSLSERAKLRANFEIDPERDGETDILVGMVTISHGPIDVTSASSTYHSSMLEIP